MNKVDKLSDRVRIVLVRPSHPGNIGATARAMKNMGLTQLVLVSPKLFPHVEATARASGADDVLQRARCVDTLEDALLGCGLVVGTSTRSRSLSWPVLDPKAVSLKICEHAQTKPVAIVFGAEQSGLSNEALARCHYHVNIPCSPDFASLNLAQAVQVMVYELYQTACAFESEAVESMEEPLADADQMEGFFAQLKATLVSLDFIKGRASTTMMLRWRRLFGRAQVRETEYHLLRGVLTAVQKRVRHE